MRNSPVKPGSLRTNEYFHMEYVLSPDACARAGINGLLSQQGKASIRLLEEVPLQTSETLHIQMYWRLTMVMPSEPRTLLDLVRKVARLIRSSSRPPRILILSPVSPRWLKQTLMSLACPGGMLIHITVLPARTDCASLAAALSGKPVAVRTGVPADAGNEPCPVLTPAEYQAVSDWLAGHSARACASRTGGSVKTVYVHRHRGRCKLGRLFPELLPRFRAPGDGVPS